MSFNRLRRLAGLNEDFTNDPMVNTEIEQRVDQQEEGTRHHWMDLLEIIYNAGERGISRQDIVTQMYAMYPDAAMVFGSRGLDEMMDVVGARFGNLVKSSPDDNWFAWAAAKPPTHNDMGEDDVDPQTRAAIGAQVDMASHAMAVMRDLTQRNGHFTEADLARHLSQRVHMPESMMQEYVHHAIGNFRSMLDFRDGQYSVKAEAPVSREQNMGFLRDLANKTTDPDL